MQSTDTSKGTVVRTWSSVRSQIRMDRSCEPVTTNVPCFATANAHTSPWWPSSFMIFSNWKKSPESQRNWLLFIPIVTYLVAIPIFENLVFACGKEVVCTPHKLDRCNAFLVCKQGLVAITKVKTPKFDIFVGGSSSNKCIIRGNVHW